MGCIGFILVKFILVFVNKLTMNSISFVFTNISHCLVVEIND